MTGLLVGIAIGGFLAFVPPHFAAEGSGSISCWSRSDAKSYNYTARYEGYKFGGGWWNNNNAHDSGEGPDCSGLVFKSWAMVNSWGSTGKYYWSWGHDIHGPYGSWHFRDGCGGACYDVCGSGPGSACGSNSYSSTIYMDAFAKDGHVAAIYSEGSSGNDWFVNALNPTVGVVYTNSGYRTDPAYDGVRRKLWSSSCLPQ
ncbi:MAG TPA: hypothetical protein VE569_02180 [Acidimicrobiia bacterium]|nr:hypothetical protein [Acidimicrobiia bacterium]